MFIVWGKKQVYRKLGWVADFCPLCRDVRMFRLRRVGLAGHLYYISLGEGDLVRHERICCDCGGAFGADPRQYAQISKRNQPLDALLLQTFPNCRDFHAERLALEKKIQRGSRTISAEERLALIREPFILLAPLVEERLASVRLDRRFWFSLLGLFILPPLFIGGMEYLLPNDSELGTLIGVAAVLVWIGWVLATAGSYYVRREIVPKLAHALRPLSPSDRELQTELVLLRGAERKLGKKLRINDLRAALTPRQSGEGQVLGVRT